MLSTDCHIKRRSAQIATRSPKIKSEWRFPRHSTVSKHALDMQFCLHLQIINEVVAGWRSSTVKFNRALRWKTTNYFYTINVIKCIRIGVCSNCVKIAMNYNNGEHKNTVWDQVSIDFSLILVMVFHLIWSWNKVRSTTNRSTTNLKNHECIECSNKRLARADPTYLTRPLFHMMSDPSYVSVPTMFQHWFDPVTNQRHRCYCCCRRCLTA